MNPPPPPPDAPPHPDDHHEPARRDSPDHPAPPDNPADPPGPTGILAIDKPLGLTSTAVCNAVKWRLRAAGAPKGVKVGHAGTLDPMATGVLIVLVGRGATRLAESLMAGRKRYLAEIDLAHTSVSDDTEREPVPAAIPRIPTTPQVQAALAAFVGTISQRPPDHSAVRVDGRRAYKIARKGRDPGLVGRPVLVHSIDLVDYAWPRLTLDIACGKGTYIRSLARDLGAALEVGGMLAGLRRTRVGPFHIGDCRELDSLPERLSQADLLPVERATPG
jgi:tRNA pseudouridine55 synthase